MTTEANMTRPDEIEILLKDRFGFPAFRAGQREVIDRLMAGRSAIAIFPTGSGKSLCYQLPALALPGVTLIISPLIALMKDQVDFLKSRGIPAARLDSALSAAEVSETMDALRNATLKLLYVAPERFKNERFLQTVQRCRIDLMAIDEGHCISEWGHNFRPDYLKLAQIARDLNCRRVLALTATATPAVVSDMCRTFDVSDDCVVRTGFYRPNLTLKVTPVTPENRDALLVDRIRCAPAGPTIVYVTLQKTAERVAELLQSHGLDARPYHAGLGTEQRHACQEWFMASDAGIVTATIAFGMGIDKSNIRAIYHYNLPKSLENYSQEIGRAGRDGLESVCELFVTPADLITLENFVYGDVPTRQAVSGVLQEVFSLGEAFDLSIYDLSFRHDIRPLVLETLLTYLELDGYLREGTPFYSEYTFKPNVSSAQILSHFSGERAAFLRQVLAQARPAKIWFSLDVHSIAQRIGQDRDRIVRALDYLAEKEFITLKAEGLRNRFQLLERPQDLPQLAERLYQQFKTRETRDIDRLRRMFALATHGGCVTNELVGYFGEQRENPCGHCSGCRGDGQDRQTATMVAAGSADRSSDAADRIRSPAFQAELQAVIAQHPSLLNDPIVVARFLCGITSPKLTRAKLSSHPLFGRITDASFTDVLATVAGRS